MKLWGTVIIITARAAALSKPEVDVLVGETLAYRFQYNQAEKYEFPAEQQRVQERSPKTTLVIQTKKKLRKKCI